MTGRDECPSKNSGGRLRKNPVDSARSALKKVLAQRDAARQRLAELDAVVAELSGVLKPTQQLPPHLKLTLPPELIQEDAPEDELAMNDNLGKGRWC